MKKLFVFVALLVLLTACGVPQEDYDVAVNQALALDSDLLHCQSGLTYCDANLEYTTDQISEAEGELRNTSILLSELQVENDKLATSLADVKRELSQLTYTNQQLTGLMFCGGINRDWSVKSVSEALASLDDTDQWDFRSGTFRNFRVWNNASVRYVSVRATDDGEEYGFPYIIYPVEELRANAGIFNLSDQCWTFMDIPAIPTTGTDA